jgi:hypothetical protein
MAITGKKQREAVKKRKKEEGDGIHFLQCNLDKNIIAPPEQGCKNHT